LATLVSALSLTALLAVLPLLVHWLRGETASATAPSLTTRRGLEPQLGGHEWPQVRWRSSRSIGLPTDGRLVRGVQLPAEGPDFFTWSFVRSRPPNPGWRRYGSSRLVRTVLEVIAAYRAAHPDAPRVGIGDLSRRHGGEFGPRFGGLGHASHQNGRDVDVYYPRRDGRERAPLKPSQVDRKLAQDLVDRFVKAGAQFVFVGYRARLDGPPDVVQAIPNHEDHLHVRIP
jgi:murein endopeptidase